MASKRKPIPPKLKNLVRDAMRRHAWNIGVSHYNGDIIYADDDKKSDDGGFVNGEMHVDRRYLHATLYIFPEAIRNWQQDGDDFIEHLVAHEAAHIATQHMMDLVISCYKDQGETKDAWESLTEMIGRMSIKIAEAKK